MTHDLFPILRAALWGGSDTPPLSSALRAELQAQAVEGLTAHLYPGSLKYQLAAQFVWMATAQADAVKLLQDAGIPVAVLKGTAAGIYYPQPYLRTYGDIDLLVSPENYTKSLQLLASNGWLQLGEIGASHTAIQKGSFLFELHQSPPGLERVEEGDYILRTLLSGLNDIQTGVIDQPSCVFPMLPWQQNGLELIWHFREHLYNGIGLRHAIDWMMFVHRHLDDAGFEHFKGVLEKSGLLMLARTVTRMCQLYLGLEETITWCKDVDEALCEDLMRFILDQGNFGQKRTDDKAAKVLTRYYSPLKFLRAMQRFGTENWPAARKNTFLRPFAWLYTGTVGTRNLFTKEGRQRLADGLNESRRRRELFTRLYGGDAPQIVVPPSKFKQPQQQKSPMRKLPLKMRIRPLYERVAHSPLRGPLYWLENLYFTVRYPLFGKPKISASERENVEQNVTFIYKSFNRQKLAKRCYKVIKQYYPNARVVIADDSAEPLQISNLAEGDLVLHLPFNSGLSKGLIAALEEVKTPYTMRLDDDELLTPASNIHGQLAFLQKHNEVDLVGLQAKHIRPERGAAGYSRIRMNKQLIIPSGTLIDGREVVYKTADLFLVRTQSYRKVGYDPNIRMTIHQEFFYRAAGQIVCVQDPHAFILHCHNHFAKKNYAKYRADYSGDMAYISKKHGGGYR